ncbi:DNA-processing protein DprA [uncultured Anaerococcus sp.]|uniref:DNA-processing protein DprA n=1 Tax=uncultured Anaerococcus sp. TaxID=293428 RepID=UPI00288A667E|nr:DNA-processing protein DprA [uncultured Anaerococcus sp.]
MDKREILLYLNYININNRTIIDIFDNTGLEKFFERSRIDFPYLVDQNYDKIFNPKNLEDFKAYREKVARLGVDFVTILDEDYPENLRHIDDRPVVLYYKGSLDSIRDSQSIAFVGARKCTDYGKWACKNLAGSIAQAGITTVSGLAYGIDAMCHKATLEVGGRTIGVIGCGIDQVYPKANKFLYEKIEEEGLILSEFPLETPPIGYNFPRRNRIISGISLATVVIEAKEKSGTMITTRCALDQGKEVFAVPGNINSIYSKGTNKLIQDGSKLILSAEDILDELDYLLDKKIEKKTIDYSALDKDEVSVVRYIENNPNASADSLALNLDLSIDVINFLLTSLELKNIIENIGNNEFTIKE